MTAANFTKPTAYQAKLLRMLAREGNEKWVILVNTLNYARPRAQLLPNPWDPDCVKIGYDVPLFAGDQIKYGSVKVCIDQGWLIPENEEDPKNPFRRSIRYKLSDCGRAVFRSLQPKDFESLYNSPAMKEADIIDALRGRYHDESKQGWIMIDHLPNGTGSAARRTIDAYAINLWPMRRMQAISFEVKVTRSDYLREIKEPLKRQYAWDYSNEFYFATPAGMIKPDELPEGCGLIEISLEEPRTCMIKVKAKSRPKFDIPWWFLSAIARKLNRC